MSWPAFPSLKANVEASSAGAWKKLCFAAEHFGNIIDKIYHTGIKNGRSNAFISFFRTYYHRLGCDNVSELMNIFINMDMSSFGDMITQDVLLLGAEKDYIVYASIAGEQKEKMPNANSVRVRILTDKENASDHCNCGNQKLAMDVVLDWLADLDNAEK